MSQGLPSLTCPGLAQDVGPAAGPGARLAPCVGPIAWTYSPAEIVADGVIHALGVVLSLGGLAALALSVAGKAQPVELAAAIVYGAALVAALVLSASYNLWPVSAVKWWLRRLDHSAIFVLIAGTYTPFITQMRDGATAGGLLAWMWGVAVAGIALKIARPGRYDRATIVLYVGLSMSGIAFGEAFTAVLPASTLALLAVGGALYISGIAFHVWESLRFQNAIWHGFVLAAAACHYAAVLDCLVLSRA